MMCNAKKLVTRPENGVCTLRSRESLRGRSLVRRARAVTTISSKVETGRALAGAGLDTGTCYFEWSAPEDADPADPARD
jgi:hypothetical protein